MISYDQLFVDVTRASNLTVGNVATIIGNIKREHPDMEIFIDGDSRAIVGRFRH